MAVTLIESRVEIAAAENLARWHSRFNADGERAALERRVLQTRQPVPLSNDVPVQTASGDLTARLELGIYYGEGRRSIEFGLRFTEALPDSGVASVLGGSPVDRAKDGSTIRTAFIPVREIGALQEIVPAGVILRLSQELSGTRRVVRAQVSSAPSVNGLVH